MTTGRINQVSCVRLEELADGVFSSAVYPSQQTFKIFFSNQFSTGTTPG